MSSPTGNVILMLNHSSSNSLLSFFKDQLTDYMKAYSIVKIVRMPERVGLIRARLAGLPYSTAEVVTYLDSHCECTNGKSKSTFMMNKHYNDMILVI